jgi:GGDEF domain-containing protein
VGLFDLAKWRAERGIMKQAPTSLALTVLVGVLWPVAAAALIGGAALPTRAPLAWTLLALVIVITVMRPFPFADLVGSAVAALAFVAADTADRYLRGGPLLDVDLRQVVVVAGVLVVTPLLMRLLVAELERLVEQLTRQEAKIDSLTMREESGAFRGRFLDSILDEEIGRARRYRRSLMIGVLAIDEWDELTEESTPAQIQRLSRSVEEQVLATIRPVDKVVSAGKGEWVIVLPETPLEGAAVVASRLHDRLSQSLDLPLRIGLADFPRDAVTRDGLLAEARQALGFARVAGLPVVDRSLLSEAS